MNLKNQFLIALPDMADSRFKQAVILICDHSENGALGIVINHHSEVIFDDVLKSLKIPFSADKSFPELYEGGPVNTESGFIIHQDTQKFSSSLSISSELTLTTSQDIIKRIAMGKLDSNWLFAMGCATWDQGQLEKELSENAWLTCPCDQEIIFQSDFNDKWSKALKLLGISPHQLSGDFGHA